jgi:hypothetical protein
VGHRIGGDHLGSAGPGEQGGQRGFAPGPGRGGLAGQAAQVDPQHVWGDLGDRSGEELAEVAQVAAVGPHGMGGLTRSDQVSEEVLDDRGHRRVRHARVTVPESGSCDNDRVRPRRDTRHRR